MRSDFPNPNINGRVTFAFGLAGTLAMNEKGGTSLITTQLAVSTEPSPTVRTCDDEVDMVEPAPTQTFFQ